MMNEPLLYMDTLLDSDLAGFFTDDTKYQEIITTRLEKNRLLFDSKLRILGNGDLKTIESQITARTLQIEQEMQKKHLPQSLLQVATVSSLADGLIAFLQTGHPDGLYLTKTAAEEILATHRPENLNSLSSQLTTISPLEKLSLTRHTEPKAWQEKYLQLLETLDVSHFETRPVRYTSFDTEKLLPIMDASDIKQKPWRMSHAKETGYINIFTQDAASIETGTPTLLFVLVLFHYYFETLFSGQFFAQQKTTTTLGAVVTNVIRSGADKFSFFHPNTYTEHLYWSCALKAFTTYTKGSVDISFFADTLTCGEYISSAGASDPLSLNLIDRIWNLTIKDDAKRSYFQFSGASFLYHFREGLWYEILSSIANLSPTEMSECLRKNLAYGDKTLTKQLLEKLYE